MNVRVLSGQLAARARYLPSRKSPRCSVCRPPGCMNARGAVRSIVFPDSGLGSTGDSARPTYSHGWTGRGPERVRMVDSAITIVADAGRSGRANGKDMATMARRRYQEGHLLIRGKRMKKWVARWRENVICEDGTLGRVQRTVVIGAVSELTKREALNELKKRLGPMNEGTQRAEATITFDKFAHKWEEAILPTYRASTRYFYHNTLHRHLLPQFATHRLCDIQPSDVQLFLTHKAERYAPSVLHHIRATLSRIFAAATKWNYVDGNPADGVVLPSKRSVRPKTTFKPNDVRRILAHLAQPYRSMVIMAALTGMRASEFFALTWADVDFERALIFVRRTFYRGQFGPPKTASSERAVPMGPLLADALREHLRLAPPNESGLVFCDAAGNPHDAGNLARRVLTPVLQIVGLPNTGWRAFRRSVATALSELHEPVRTAQQVLGHSSPTTTLAFYTQTEEKSQRDALSKLEELLFPSVPKFAKPGELIH